MAVADNSFEVAAAGTRQPRTYIIAAVRGVDNAVWTTTYPTDATPSGWSGFTRVWVPES